MFSNSKECVILLLPHSSNRKMHLGFNCAVSSLENKTSLSNTPYCWVRSFRNTVFTDSVHQVHVVVCCGLENWVYSLKGNESSSQCHMIGCVCHGATCSLRPLQSAGESMPEELRGGILPRQAGRDMQALWQGLRYLCRWEHRSKVMNCMKTNH